MAEVEIGLDRIPAGREYCQVLEAAGMDLHAALWAYDLVAEEFVLVLVTDFFDFKGPLEISKKLFKAYNASVTPKEIDPFVVRLHSAGQPFVEELLHFADFKDAQLIDRITGEVKSKIIGVTSASVGELEVRTAWLLFSRKNKKRDSVELSRRWRRFSENIDKMAA